MPAANTTYRQLQIVDIATAVRRLLKTRLLVLVVLLGAVFVYLQLKGDRGASAFGLIAVSNILILAAWSRDGSGLPLVPMLAFQNLLAYALPLATHNETLQPYATETIDAAGWEVFAFSLALLAGWRLGVQVVPSYSSMSYALEGLDDTSPRLKRMGMIMIGSTTAYTVLASLRLLNPVLSILPIGSESLIHVLTAAVSACGFFLTAMMLGKGTLNGLARGGFWLMLFVQCYIAASAFLLSTTITVVFSAIIGLFWGSGKIPWRFLIGTLAILSFLNLGKFTMRDRYWLKTEGNPTPDFALTEMPHYYGEWVDASWTMLTSSGKEDDFALSFDSMEQKHAKKESGQSLFDRINNMQNLLYVVDVMQHTKVQPLGGSTYALIGPLLVPRIIWPDKPRTHEGQVLLNVHFGRQALESTYTTYIAWGLLPEAYGNFGPFGGSITLGLVLGLLCVWLEKFSARKLVLSTEGFLSFTILLGMANSFEMVASVLVTSLFQACIPIVLACAPFVRRVSADPRPRGHPPGQSAENPTATAP